MLTLEPIWQPAAQQAQFRILLDAMSRPGRCYTLVNIPQEGQVALAILVSLLDAEVLFSDPHNLLCDEDWPMLQARPASSEVADYILCDATVVPDFTPKLGTLISLEKSATLVLVVNEFGNGGA